MDELSLTNSTIKSKIVWHQLLPNLQCTQGSDKNFDYYEECMKYILIIFDIKLRDRDVKSITLVDKDAAQVSISKLAYIEYFGCSTRMVAIKANAIGKAVSRKKTYRMAKVIRKEITSKSTNVTPSILATEFMNNAKISSTISSTPANQVQPVSTRFMPNLEAIQNALKYNKKLYHPSALEFEKVNKSIKSSQLTMSSMDFHGNAVVFTMPYEGKKMNCKTTSTRQIDQRLPLIQAINVTKSILLMKKNILEIKTFQRRSVFPPDDVHIKQRYRLMGVSFCNGNHHIADVRFKNIKKLASIYMMDWERPTVREQ
ncbi:19596_t:CDS:2, partial [Gigaspora rosea]